MNIDIDPTGAGLPPGRGTVQQGTAIYANKCATCHGPTGTEGPKDRLVGGHDSLATEHPVKTIGSFWPYATTLYDYIHRAMPLNAPQSLTPEEVYSVVAWLLHQNGIIPADMIIDAQTLPAVKIPKSPNVFTCLICVNNDPIKFYAILIAPYDFFLGLSYVFVSDIFPFFI